MARSVLQALGARTDELPTLLTGDEIVFGLVVGHARADGVVRLRDGVLQVVVVSVVSEPQGDGIRCLGVLQGHGRALARALPCEQLELIGCAFLNERLKRVLTARGFEEEEVMAPDLAGDDPSPGVKKVLQVEQS